MRAMNEARSIDELRGQRCHKGSNEVKEWLIRSIDMPSYHVLLIVPLGPPSSIRIPNEFNVHGIDMAIPYKYPAPLTLKTWPDTQLLSFPAKKAIALAISSGSPNLLKGLCPAIIFNIFSSLPL